MQKYILTLFVVIFSSFAFSQEAESRLLKRYTQAEIDIIKSEDPNYHALLIYALDHGVYIIDVPESKNLDLQTIHIDSEKFDFISLGLEIKDQNQYFLILKPFH